MNHIIIRPVLTEKASQKVGVNIYTFQVGISTNKHEIKQALEDMFKVKVSSIRIIKKIGKMRRIGRRMQSRRLPDRKIAYVTVKEGSIDLFPKA